MPSTFASVLSIQMRMRNYIPRGLINEGNGRPIRDQIFVVVETFIVSEDIILIHIDQNFTMNATGMVLESL